METLCPAQQKKSGHLYLDGFRDHYVPRELVSKLTVHQLEGVRFLHSQLQKYTGIFLNDESGLGKSYQVVGFLSGMVIGDEHSIILCPNRDRLQHWSCVLDELAPSLRAKVHLQSYEEVAAELTLLQNIQWQYAVVDETRGFMSDQDLETLRALAVGKFVFVCSVDLLDRLGVLLKRLEFCFRPEETKHLRALIEMQHKRRTKQGNFKLYLCTRRFLLRRHVPNCRRQLPHGENCFRDKLHDRAVVNSVASGKHPETQQSEVITLPKKASSEESLRLPSYVRAMTPDALDPRSDGDGKPSEAVRVSPTISEPLFEPNETDTELMPVLRVESDTHSDIASIPETAIDVPETAPDSEGYLQFGQEMNSHFSSTQPVMASERYRFPIEKFLLTQGQLRSSSSSVSIESIPNAQQPTASAVVISSSNSSLREKSPPLFEESDHDTVSLDSFSSFDDFSLQDMLAKSRTGESSTNVITAKVATMARQLTSFSTPISKLMFGPLTNGSVQPEMDVSSVDMFADSLVAAEGDNVFEITKNNAFPNRLAVDGEDKGAATVILADDSTDDDVQFVDETHSNSVIDLVNEQHTPKKTDLNRAIVGHRTPPSGASNKTISPGRGWLGKHLRTSSLSPASGNTTPTSSKQASCSRSGPNRSCGAVEIVRDSKRRRKLDDAFQLAKDQMVSPSNKGRNTRRRGSR